MWLREGCTLRLNQTSNGTSASDGICCKFWWLSMTRLLSHHFYQSPGGLALSISWLIYPAWWLVAFRSVPMAYLRTTVATMTTAPLELWLGRQGWQPRQLKVAIFTGRVVSLLDKQVCVFCLFVCFGVLSTCKKHRDVWVSTTKWCFIGCSLGVQCTHQWEGMRAVLLEKPPADPWCDPNDWLPTSGCTNGMGWHRFVWDYSGPLPKQRQVAERAAD